MWFAYAALSAVFAALTTIFAKIGLDGVNSNLATAIRTIVILFMSWIIAFITGNTKQLGEITLKGWLFLILSGLATGASWLFYFKALQMGDASKIAPIDKMSIVITMILAFIFLKEPFTFKTAAGGILISAGVLVLAL